MQLADQEAKRSNHKYIGTEHLLLGLIKEGNGVAVNALKGLGVDFAKVRLEIETLVPSGPDMVTIGRLPQAPQTKKAIGYSLEEARNLNHPYIGTEHILLGLLRDREEVAARALMNAGNQPEEVRRAILQSVRPGQETSEGMTHPITPRMPWFAWVVVLSALAGFCYWLLVGW